jgi:nucleoside-diphosphate-sugar epimerase
VKIVPGSLEHLPDLEQVVPRGATVLHLAAQTGVASPTVFQTVNVAGTHSLLDAAKRAEAARVIFVSSIAAGYPDRTGYPYAESKRRGEQLVSNAGIPFDTVRPTIVLGPGSPALKSMCRLAGPLVGLRLGRSTVQIQPIHVEDAATTLVNMLSQPPTQGMWDLGGSDILTLASLLSLLREQLRGRSGPFITLPLGPVRGVLQLLERAVGYRLPVTTGQLSVFKHDSVAVNPPPPGCGRSSFRSLSEMFGGVNG